VALGRQHVSQRESSPCYSFGTGTRKDKGKTYIGKEHAKKQTTLAVSPGPAYAVPNTTGQGPRHVFGTEERRTNPRVQYPDSSVDLMGATVDSQIVKFSTTTVVNFGTEARMNTKNGEVVRSNPAIMKGVESPAAFEHTPLDTHVAKRTPEYTFGPPGGTDGKKVPPIRNMPAATPRTLGPGSHRLPGGLGAQTESSARSAPSWGFGTSSRLSARRDYPQLLDLSPDLSSIGRQVVSKAKTSPSAPFGKSTRDQSARVQQAFTHLDKGPAGDMPPVRHPLNVPGPHTKASRAVGTGP
jgi:hypothetical protein